METMKDSESMDEKPMENKGTDQEQREDKPLERAISTIQSYIANPKMATPETMQEVLDLLMQAKTDDEYMDNPEESDGESKEKPSLMIAIGMKKKQGGMS